MNISDRMIVFTGKGGKTASRNEKLAKITRGSLVSVLIRRGGRSRVAHCSASAELVMSKAPPG